MPRLLALCAALVLGACAGTDTGPGSLSMDGNWFQSGDLRDSITGDSHIHVGSFALAQTADSFSGTGQQSGYCRTAAAAAYAGPLSDSTTFAVSGGRLIGREMSFQRDICQYQGHFVAGKRDVIYGTATCRYSLNGVQYSFSGQWQATKRP